jgi:Protein of unknown function (DUF4058)
MALRDHFHSPLDDQRHWEGFHGQWPAMMVMGLVGKLPMRYFAEPRVHPGGSTDFPSPAEYEVRVFDTKRKCRLVAAVEIVSPANKDRPEHRHAFVAKCAALLQERVSVTIVDLVTNRRFNLYHELLELIGQTDSSLGPEPPPLYAATCRGTKLDDAWRVETWTQHLTIGQTLPTLPLWLADNLAVPLNLEESYEETCRVLRIP